MNAETRAKLVDILKRINALAENPHWTTERRWRISELSTEGLTLLVTCPEFRPDHNGECLNCDEPADAHERGTR